MTNAGGQTHHASVLGDVLPIGPVATPGVRVACDFYGPADPVLVAEGMRLALTHDPGLTLLVAAISDDLAAPFGPGGVPDRVEVRRATPLLVSGSPDGAPRAVRGHRDASVRVAARLVADGMADAGVLLGPVDVALAAARFTLRPLPGATRLVVAADTGGSILLDVSGSGDLDHGSAVLAAVLGAAFARSRGVDYPAVSVLAASGVVGDDSVAYRLLAALRPFAEGGLFRLGRPVEAAELVRQTSHPAVVVTDGFSGNVLAEALATFVAADAARFGAGLVTDTDTALPTPRGGGMVLGLEGVAVVGRADSPVEYAHAVALAAQAHRSDLLGLSSRSLADLVAWRRMSAGLNPVFS